MNAQDKEQQKIAALIAKIQLKDAVITNIEGYFYRTVSYRYSRNALSTKGAQITGGRYNFCPPNGNSFPCLYCGEQDLTASTEKFYRLKTKKAPLPPHTVVCVKVRLSKVLNLDTPDKCQQAGIDWDAINEPWEYHQDIWQIPAYTQRIGAISYETKGLEGIMFASTKVNNTVNLAIFTEKLASNSLLEVYDPRDELK